MFCPSEPPSCPAELSRTQSDFLARPRLASSIPCMHGSIHGLINCCFAAWCMIRHHKLLHFAACAPVAAARCTITGHVSSSSFNCQVWLMKCVAQCLFAIAPVRQPISHPTKQNSNPTHTTAIAAAAQDTTQNTLAANSKLNARQRSKKHHSHHSPQHLCIMHHEALLLLRGYEITVGPNVLQQRHEPYHAPNPMQIAA